eukprot:1139781-Prymnesium_polylepis.1
MTSSVKSEEALARCLAHYPHRFSGWLEKLDKGAIAWEHGSKSNFTTFERSQLQWYNKEPDNDGYLKGCIDLRTVDALRSSECAGAPVYAIDIILKGSDRAYTFVPDEDEREVWLYLMASAVPSRAVASSLTGFRDAQLVANLMREAGSLPGEEPPSSLLKTLNKLGSWAVQTVMSLEEQYRTAVSPAAGASADDASVRDEGGGATPGSAAATSRPDGAPHSPRGGLALSSMPTSPHARDSPPQSMLVAPPHPWLQKTASDGTAPLQQPHGGG